MTCASVGRLSSTLLLFLRLSDFASSPAPPFSSSKTHCSFRLAQWLHGRLRSHLILAT
jgi:hypothetical protein